ncbi:MAG: hypothetical protein ACP5UH_03060, partial [Candidatus Micrarchaeia archaeon]
MPSNYKVRQGKRAQSAMEYLVTYGWAILLVSIVIALLYLYVIVPKVVVPASCNFVSGAYCNDLVLGTNTITHATELAVFLTNTQPYPMQNPQLYVKVNNITSTLGKCSPNFVLPGGAIICNMTVPVSTSLGMFISGSIYLNATYCGLAPNYTVTHSCANAPRQTYSGSFNAHAAPLVSTTSKISITAANATNPANNAKDRLTATVDMLGYPLKGASVNFTENSTAYSLQPNLTTTNTNGQALSYIWGTAIGNVKVSADYAGLPPASVVIDFIAPETVSFKIINFPSCSSYTSPLVKVDGIAYTCSQLSTQKFEWGLNSVHTYNFTPIASTAPSTRSVFRNATVSGITYTSPNGTITVTGNTTIYVSYYTQYYFTNIANPSTGGTVTPPTGWYNVSSMNIAETPASGWFFSDWTCSGTGCYAGTSSTATITLSNPISETANFHTTSSTTTSTTSTSTSTSTTSTSTTSTSTSTTSTSTSTTSTSTSTTSTSTSTTTSTTTAYYSCNSCYTSTMSGYSC